MSLGFFKLSKFQITFIITAQAAYLHTPEIICNKNHYGKRKGQKCHDHESVDAKVIGPFFIWADAIYRYVKDLTYPKNGLYITY